MKPGTTDRQQYGVAGLLFALAAVIAALTGYDLATIMYVCIAAMFTAISLTRHRST